MKAILDAGDVFIWITSVLAGAALVLGLWKAAASYARSPKDAALLGEWYTYGYFHSSGGPVFYRERGLVKRHFLLPWIFTTETIPLDGDGSTIYRGSLTSHSPYLYFTAFEPVYHDRTFEIYCRRMEGASDSKLLLGIHLGRSYDEGVHTACAVIMSRSPLDKNASPTRPPDEAVERLEFERICRSYFLSDPQSLQLLMFQSPRPSSLNGYDVSLRT